MRRAPETLTPEDDALLTAAIAGDATAVARVLERHHPDIRRFAQKLCLASEVEEAAQDSLVLVFRHLPTFRRAARFTSWLLETIGPPRVNR